MVPLTIFAVFGNKRSVLADLVNISVGGDDRAIPLLERPGPRAVLTEPDANRQIHLFAVDISDILERVAPVFEIMRMAAKTEPEIEDLLQRILEERLSNLGKFVQTLSNRGNLREGLDDIQATEIVWSIASPEVYRLLTIDRGWSKARFAQWLGDILARLLLP